MMEKRGQSALEYLMTYGWALIVIAIVIGVLIYVTSTSSGGVTCQSKSGQIIVKEWSISVGTNNASVVIQNATGGNITLQGAFSGGDFAADGNTADTAILKNGTMPITGLSGPASAGTFSDGAIGIRYTTAGGLTADANITCAGTV